MMEPIERSHRLSRLQQAVLGMALAEEDGGPAELLVCTIDGDVSLAAFEAAWGKVIAHHPALRTSFEWKGLQEPLQHVHAAATWELRRHDWRGLGAAERRKALGAERGSRWSCQRPSLMRLSLARIEEGRFIFVWSSSDLILDGRARLLLLEQVDALYAARLGGGEPVLPSAEAHGRHLRGRLASEAATGAAAYWRDLLRAAAAPALPTLSAPAVLGPAGERYGSRSVELPIEIEAELRSGAQRLGVTLACLVQGAWAVLLSRYSGQDDVVLDEVRAGAAGPEATVVGVVRDVAPRRVKAFGSAASLLTTLQAQHAASSAHGQPPSTAAGRSGAAVALADPSVDVPRAFGASSLWHHGIERHIRPLHPLTLGGCIGPRIQLAIDYDRRRFEDAAMEVMARHLVVLARGLVADPGRSVGAMPLLSDAERRRTLVEWNATADAAAGGDCVHVQFERQARRTPDAMAVVHAGRRVTYAELNGKANRVARRLRALGVGPETRVAIYMSRGLHMVAAVLATLKAGGAYVPLEVGWPEARLRTMLEDARPRIALMEPGQQAPLAYPDLAWMSLDWDAEEPAGSDGDEPAGGDLTEAAAYVLYTSGSTGRPKGVVIEHRQLANYVTAVTERARIQRGQTFAMVQPLSVDSSVTALYSSLCHGGCLHVIGEDLAKDPAALGAYFEGEGIDWLKIAPSHLATLHGCGNPRRLMPRRGLIVGGEASRSEWLGELRAVAPECEVFNHYGPTETTVGVLMHRSRATDSTERGRTAPLGRPLGNVRAYVLDALAAPVPQGVMGELYIGGAAVARGYLNQPRATAAHFLPDPFAEEPGARMYRTGDLARHLPDGAVEYCGRADGQIKVRGYRIEPGEIEAALALHPQVEHAVVAATQEGSGERRLIAYLVTRRGGAAVAETMAAFLRTRLPEQMIPAEFVVLDRLPLTEHGKVDHRALRAPGPAGEAASEAVRAADGDR
jgi:amino acid adenylation domain-containing protein